MAIRRICLFAILLLASEAADVLNATQTLKDVAVESEEADTTKTEVVATETDEVMKADTDGLDVESGDAVEDYEVVETEDDEDAKEEDAKDTEVVATETDEVMKKDTDDFDVESGDEAEDEEESEEDESEDASLVQTDDDDSEEESSDEDEEADATDEEDESEDAEEDASLLQTDDDSADEASDDTEEADVTEDEEAEVFEDADVEDASSVKNSGYRTCNGRKTWDQNLAGYSPMEDPIANDDACKKCCEYQGASMDKLTVECTCGSESGDGASANDNGFLVAVKGAALKTGWQRCAMC